jgi:O-antigen ligase
MELMPNLKYQKENYLALIALILYYAFFFYLGRREELRQIPTLIITPLLFVYSIFKNGIKINFSDKVFLAYFIFVLYCCISLFWVPIGCKYSIKATSMLLGNLVILFISNTLIPLIKNVFLLPLTIGISVLLFAYTGFDLSGTSTVANASSELDLTNTFISLEENANTIALINLVGIIAISIFISYYDSFLIKLGGTLSILFLLYATALTASRSGLVTCSTAPVLFYIFNNKVKTNTKISLVLLVIFIVGPAVYVLFSDLPIFQKFQTTAVSNSDLARAGVAEEAWLFFKKSPVFGTGIGSLVGLSQLGLYAHNDLLEVLSNMGLTGLTLYLLFYYYLIRAFYLKMKLDVFLIKMGYIVIFVFAILGLFLVIYNDTMYFLILSFAIAHLPINLKA